MGNVDERESVSIHTKGHLGKVIQQVLQIMGKVDEQESVAIRTKGILEQS